MSAASFERLRASLASVPPAFDQEASDDRLAEVLERACVLLSEDDHSVDGAPRRLQLAKAVFTACTRRKVWSVALGAASAYCLALERLFKDRWGTSPGLHWAAPDVGRMAEFAMYTAFKEGVPESGPDFSEQLHLLTLRERIQQRTFEEQASPSGLLRLSGLAARTWLNDRLLGRRVNRMKRGLTPSDMLQLRAVVREDRRRQIRRLTRRRLTHTLSLASRSKRSLLWRHAFLVERSFMLRQALTTGSRSWSTRARLTRPTQSCSPVSDSPLSKTWPPSAGAWVKPPGLNSWPLCARSPTWCSGRRCGSGRNSTGSR
jgi:hypothetical protein